jgi:hypothetical protein
MTSDYNKEILEELKKINLRLDKIEKGIDNMNNHITFIDSVYETIKYPFYSIINKFHKINEIPEKKLITE